MRSSARAVMRMTTTPLTSRLSHRTRSRDTNTHANIHSGKSAICMKAASYRPAPQETIRSFGSQHPVLSSLLGDRPTTRARVHRGPQQAPVLRLLGVKAHSLRWIYNVRLSLASDLR